MQQRHDPALFFALLSGLLAVFLLRPEGPYAHATGVLEHDFVGAESCRACHQEAYDVWSKGPHAKAFDGLRDVERRDQRCIQCHTMVPDDPDPALGGVQCETCHGPGRYYAKDYVMRDEELRSKLLFEVPDEKTCARCHSDNTPRLAPFSYQEGRERIRHWRDKPPTPAADAK